MSEERTEAPQLADLLYLLTIPQIGPGRIRRLFQVFSSLEEILKAPVQRLVNVDGIDYKLAAQIKSGGEAGLVDKQLELIEKKNIRYVTIWDRDYPEKLKWISDPPALLFYRGKLDARHDQALAVVGTRTPSSYGKVVATELVRQLVAAGLTIVSGMARGIDAIAHQVAIREGGQTVGVLGNGVDRCYPVDNRRLYQQIPEHGALFSEYFLGTGPDAANFPRRNRIISGLTLGTLVVEAGDRSGALITALYALNHNREVFAVPGNINSPQSTGANRLIKHGAKLVQKVEDILDEISGLSPKPAAAPRPVPDNLSQLEKKLLSCLSNDPKHIDRLVMEMKESPSVVLSTLLTLELLGFVQQLAGKMFVRI